MHPPCHHLVVIRQFSFLLNSANDAYASSTLGYMRYMRALCMCATLACMPSFHLFLLALPRGIHDHVDEAVHVLRVGNVVDSPWRLRPRGSSVLEAVNVESENRAYDVQEDVLGSVEERNLQPYDEGESQLVPDIPEPVRVIQEVVIPNIDEVNRCEHNPIREPLGVALAPTNRGTRRLRAIFGIFFLLFFLVLFTLRGYLRHNILRDVL
mmetsp:Transcript_15002/g.29477  ORF Transcript_15002/g.29477 Transcript_15002/m.29477 type:complete len:210 (-) Transcript_15002:766-1395(-)